LRMLAEGGKLARLVRDVELAGAIVDVDAVGGGKFEQVRLGFLAELERCLGPLEPELSFELLRTPTLPSAALPPIAARRPVAEAMRLDKHHVDAGLRQMHCRRQSGEAAADDDDVRRGRTVEGRVGGPLANRVLVPRAAGGDGRLICHTLVSSA